MAASAVAVCAYSSDPAKCFAVASPDGRVYVWDASSGALRHEYAPSSHLSATCSCLSWGPPRKCKDAPQRKKRRSETTGRLAELDLLAMGTAVGSVLLYSTVKGELHSKLDGGHDGRVNCVQWHPETDSLYSCSDDQHIVEWSVVSAKVKCKWKGDKGGVSSLCLSPDGKRLISAGRAIKLWDLETKKLLRKFTGHATTVSLMMFATTHPPNDIEAFDGITGLYFVTGAAHDRFLNVWQVKDDNKKTPAVALILTDEPTYVDLVRPEKSDEPMKVVVLCNDGKLHIFEYILNGTCKKPLKPRCSLQLVTQGKDETPRPLPVLAAAFCADQCSLMLAYGPSIRPVLERVAIDKSESMVCLVRDEPTSLAIKMETKVTKTKTPLVPGKAKVLAPGVPGHTSTVQAVAVLEKAGRGKKRKGDQGAETATPAELSLEERLSTMQLGKGGRRPGEQPQADGFSVLLTQGLESNDSDILNKVLQTKNEIVIRNTVQQLAIHMIMPLLRVLTKRIQSHPFSAVMAMRWVRAVLTIHASYLAAIPDLVQQMAVLYQLMDSRIRVHQRLAQMSGKLCLMMSQLDVARKANIGSGVQQTAQLVYEEESSDEEVSEDELMGKEEDSDNWEEIEEQEEGGDDSATEMNAVEKGKHSDDEVAESD
uniref:WD repeat-containing protein 43 n=1 Tax=Petromyzon marinus TaxID=7757 RepID=A0AAJ7TPV0_PETMA|nr:WD repeat-containing protein 43 [Petromyzon marinus]